MGRPGLVKQRVAARLLLASCTVAIGLGLGTAIAVTGILALQHPTIRVRSPGQRDAYLDRGVHELFVSRNHPGGEPPVAESRPVCTVTDTRSGQPAAAVPTDAGFVALRIERSGHQRVSCTSAVPLTVVVSHRGERAVAYLAALGRGLLPAVILTVLGALLAARALVTAHRLRSTPHPGAPPEGRRS